MAALHRTALISILALFLSPASAAENKAYGSFSGTLKLEDVPEQYVDTGPYDPGHTEFRLLEDYVFTAASGKNYTVPAGVVVNGASIPKAVWSVVGGPWSGRYRNASVLRDFMSENLLEDSETVHRLFYEAMLASGVSRAKAKLMYFAVLKGGPQWTRRPGFLPPVVTRGEVTEAELEEFRQRLEVEDIPLSVVEALARQ